MKEEEKAKRVRGAVALGQHDDRVRAVIHLKFNFKFKLKFEYLKVN